jgi:hypothetical protein
MNLGAIDQILGSAGDMVLVFEPQSGGAIAPAFAA